MKKILSLLPMLAALFFVGCSSDNDEQTIKISLDKQSVTIPRLGEDYISVSGANLNDCTFSLEDDFFANVTATNGKIKINAQKAGSTKLQVSCNESKAECTITIDPLMDYIGIPHIEFGGKKKSIKENESNRLMMETDDIIEYFDEKIMFGAYHFYHFLNGELEYIVTKVEIPRFSGGESMPKFTERCRGSLDERYDYVGPYSGKEQKNIVIYTLRHKYYIGARLAGGNGGWYICYAKSLDKVKKILDVGSSSAIV